MKGLSYKKSTTDNSPIVSALVKWLRHTAVARACTLGGAGPAVSVDGGEDITETADTKQGVYE